MGKALLRWLGLKRYGLFISPDMKRYILKEVKGGTYCLSLRDLKHTKEIGV